jgi:hypothetical protein
MIRRLQSMFIWNAHHQVHNAQMHHYYNSLATRNSSRTEARRQFETDLCRIRARM